MELSMLRETNGNQLLHTANEVNGGDTSTLNAGTTNNEQYAPPQTHDTTADKETTFANGSLYPPQPRLKSEDKPMNEPSQSTPKAGTSPPTEHKQHLHLPLRKRHLLASSTGSHHSENLNDSNHTIAIQTIGVHDSETSLTTNNTSTELEPHTKHIYPTSTEHTDPPDPPEPPETNVNIVKHQLPEHPPPEPAKAGNGDRSMQEHKAKHEHKDLHQNDSTPHTGQDTLTHDSSTNLSQTGNTSNNKRTPQTNPYSSHQHFTHQHTAQAASYPLQSQHLNQHSQHVQNPPHKLSTLMHNSPTRTHSPTGTQSPTRAPSPSSQSARHSSSRGRGSGRGRGKSTKGEGIPASSTTNATHTAASSGEELYCFCRRPYDPTVDVFMICCDSCDEWYHGSCVGVNQREAKKIARYVCPRCKKMPTSPSTVAVTSPEVSSEGEPSTPPSTKSKKRKNETSFKTEPKRQALSPPMSDNGVDASNEESRYCLNCNKQALSQSKYCGQECGLEYARKQYHYNGSKKPSSATEIADKEVLDEIARKKTDIAEKLNLLAKEQRDLERAIQFAQKMDAIAVPNARSTSPTTVLDTDEGGAKSHAPASENTTIDCISCGHPIAENNVLMVGTTADGGSMYCNAYDGKTKTFCKKLKNACALHAVKRHANGSEGSIGLASGSHLGVVGSSANGNARRSSPQTCGCPTGDFQSGYCELIRKACVKHHNWEDLMRDSISNQRTQHNKILAGLEAEEHAVRLRMARRSQAAMSSYRTIEEA